MQAVPHQYSLGPHRLGYWHWPKTQTLGLSHRQLAVTGSQVCPNAQQLTIPDPHPLLQSQFPHWSQTPEGQLGIQMPESTLMKFGPHWQNPLILTSFCLQSGIQSPQVLSFVQPARQTHPPLMKIWKGLQLETQSWRVGFQLDPGGQLIKMHLPYRSLVYPAMQVQTPFTLVEYGPQMYTQVPFSALSYPCVQTHLPPIHSSRYWAQWGTQVLVAGSKYQLDLQMGVQVPFIFMQGKTQSQSRVRPLKTLFGGQTIQSPLKRRLNPTRHTQSPLAARISLLPQMGMHMLPTSSWPAGQSHRPVAGLQTLRQGHLPQNPSILKYPFLQTQPSGEQTSQGLVQMLSHFWVIWLQRLPQGHCWQKLLMIQKPGLQKHLPLLQQELPVQRGLQADSLKLKQVPGGQATQTLLIRQYPSWHTQVLMQQCWFSPQTGMHQPFPSGLKPSLQMMGTQRPFSSLQPSGQESLQSPSNRRGQPLQEPQSTMERMRQLTEMKSIWVRSIGPMTSLKVSSMAEEMEIGAAVVVEKLLRPTMQVLSSLMPCLGMVMAVVEVTQFWSMIPSAQRTPGVFMLNTTMLRLTEWIMLFLSTLEKVKQMSLPWMLGADWVKARSCLLTAQTLIPLKKDLTLKAEVVKSFLTAQLSSKEPSRLVSGWLTKAVPISRSSLEEARKLIWKLFQMLCSLDFAWKYTRSGVILLGQI